MPAGRVTQIYNGVDVERFRPAPTGKAPIPGCPFSDPGLFIVGTVGRMEAVKDPVNLARAFVAALSLAPRAREQAAARRGRRRPAARRGRARRARRGRRRPRVVCRRAGRRARRPAWPRLLRAAFARRRHLEHDSRGDGCGAPGRRDPRRRQRRPHGRGNDGPARPARGQRRARKRDRSGISRIRRRCAATARRVGDTSSSTSASSAWCGATKRSISTSSGRGRRDRARAGARRRRTVRPNAEPRILRCASCTSSTIRCHCTAATRFARVAILREQRALGWETLQLTTPRHRATEREVEEVDGWTFHRTPMRNGIGPKPPGGRPICSRWPPRGAGWTDLAGAFKPDVIHAHSPVLNAFPAISVGRRLGIPVVYEVRALWEDAAVDHGTTREGSVRYRLSRALETAALRRVDHVTTICEGLQARDRGTRHPRGADHRHPERRRSGRVPLRRRAASRRCARRSGSMAPP